MEQNNCLDKKGVDVLVHINNKEFKKFQIVNADKNQAGKIGVYSAERRKHRRKIVLFARSNKTIFKKFDNEVETTCADVVCSIREKIEKYR